jgi:DNA-binding IscR family transcriptional regulator
VVDCVEDPDGCPRSELCECRVVYGLINNRIVQVLRDYTLEDLLDPSWIHDAEAVLARSGQRQPDDPK